MVHTVSADFEYMARLDFQSLALSRKKRAGLFVRCRDMKNIIIESYSFNLCF